jgi:GH15 family glucan-1,4-alpha-glucosidase
VHASVGSVRVRVRCAPAFEYASVPHTMTIADGVACFESLMGRFVLRSGVELVASDGAAVAEFTVDESSPIDFILEWDGDARPLAADEAEAHFQATLAYWQRWLRQSTYRGRWREMVERSALCLKLLVHEPSGALVAAPTTSLPEVIGSERNWDYRFTWLRDSALTLSSLMRLGFVDEAASFMRWLEARCEDVAGSGLQVMYGIDGRKDLTEVVLDHLEGHRGSKPVRVGNAAAGQLQLDITGEIMEAVFTYDQLGGHVSYGLWTALAKQLEWLADNWERPDASIWEPRCGPKRFTYSAVMTWVAFDRAVRLSRERGLPAPREEWRAVADRAYHWVQTQGWDAHRGAYVQYPGSGRLDAALLTLPLVGFCGPTDPRFLATLDAIGRELMSDSLVRRYDDGDGWDGLEGREGTFSLCTFWFVEALTRAGRLLESRRVFEKMLIYANHVGLYAEEIGHTGQALGNFPQAFTHLALISAALNLDDALDRTSG